MTGLARLINPLILGAASLLVLAFAAAFARAMPRKTPSEAPPSASLPAKTSKLRFAGKLPISELSEQEAILHALNRLGYGPRPGDLERVEKLGLENWIQGQLHPEAIPDPVIEARTANHASLSLDTAALLDTYPAQSVAAKRLGLTVAAYQQHIQDIAKLPPGTSTPPFKDQKEIVNDLIEMKVVRAVASERQLAQQLEDFWFNHFNVFIYKDLDLWYMPSYERDVLRPHVLGKFRDLLEATAKSPAMLFYLDNSSSADPQAFDRLKQHPAAVRPGVKLPPIGGKRGLNENYGRELMELHTLGADGGYSQQDVINVARAFTGWTIESPRENPQFYFDDRLHDPNPKRVLGKNFHAGGIKDAEQIMDVLAKDPHTAHHISLELAQHFVSDNPPEILVKSMAKTYEKSKGDIRAVMTTMIYSPEFWSRSAYRAKVKTPLELVASAVRAIGADVDQPLQMAQWIARMGEPLYQYLTPNGYSDKASAWVSTGSLLDRLNFAVALTGNKIRGTQFDVASHVGSDVAENPKLAFDRVVDVFLAGQISDATRTVLDKEITEPQVAGATLDDHIKHVNLGLVSGLVLGSPDFQRR